MAVKQFKGNGKKRDGTNHSTLPWVVLDSPGYRRASHTARSLLIDIGRQYNGFNNGKLVACTQYLKPMGWRSNSTVLRALRELMDCGLLLETRKGARPNKAAWFALTWVDLDQTHGLDIDPKSYQRAHRGSYMSPSLPEKTSASDRTRQASAARTLAAAAIRTAKKTGSLRPPDGAGANRIAPLAGVSPSVLAPWDGVVDGDFRPPSTPSDSAYLEIPSTPLAAGDEGSSEVPGLLQAVFA